ncbi:hypothetical protein LSS_04511 [Leptospira santarosai serovar Shermani str. LT 821]|uniref:Uncharacterized protein n=1 Tax=Leptospira santarosai serovar Shermani str. LT 821 TaxID=758847 RepID=K8Y324_9LEPT|nr:hypothetical protein LSS_04511 [Leptospira santarosai serovar Shermani str. LT 821]
MKQVDSEHFQKTSVMSEGFKFFLGKKDAIINANQE